MKPDESFKRFIDGASMIINEEKVRATSFFFNLEQVAESIVVKKQTMQNTNQKLIDEFAHSSIRAFEYINFW